MQMAAWRLGPALAMGNSVVLKPAELTPSSALRLAELATFPSEVSRRRLEAIGVTHIVLHLEPLRAAVGQAAIDRIDQVPWVTREFEDATARVYRVRRDAP